MDTILTITELSAIVKSKIEGDPFLTSVWVKGELSNITYHSSGHIYFTLKDKNAVISAAFFKGANRSLKFRLEDGLAVIAFGSVTVYEKTGRYQLIVADVKLEGIGELQKKIEQLKKKLSGEGLFDPSRRKKLPFLPKRIGVVTSPTGAAFRDILKVALRRFPAIEIVLAPAKVQGDDAAATIVRGIEELNNPAWGIDVIIAGRGGGSFEDLLPFSEESVVRAFASSRVPIISAVGHQIDHPLSDDAADQYAPTPSAAAEIAVPVQQDLAAEIDYDCEKMERALQTHIQRERARLDSVMSRRVMSDPLQLIYMKQIDLSELQNRMSFALRDISSALKDRFAAVPGIERVMRVYLEKTKNRFGMAASKVDQLSPLGTIARGYAVACDSRKNLVKSVDQVSNGGEIALYLRDGRLKCTVDEVHKGETLGKGQ
jgi:exodeoxyribonuclease VII large subunit